MVVDSEGKRYKKERDALKAEVDGEKKESNLQRVGRLRAEELVQHGIEACDELRGRAEKAEARITELYERLVRHHSDQSTQERCFACKEGGGRESDHYPLQNEYDNMEQWLAACDAYRKRKPGAKV